LKELLDNLRIYPRIDREDMYSKIFNMPSDIEYVLKAMEYLKLPEKIVVKGKSIEYGRPNNVVICGMGGSAIGGIILKDLLWELTSIPIEVVRDYVPPSYIDEKSLVILVSYSGNTEETLNCLLYSLKSGAMLYMITSNGALLKVAEKHSIPHYRVPKGYPPRAAIIHLTLPSLYIISKLLDMPIYLEQLRDTVKLLRKLRTSIAREVPFEENIAKVSAMKLLNKIPIIYSYRPYRGIGYRLKTQFNENCKILAFFEEVPEMNHNGIMGWESTTQYSKTLKVVIIRGSKESTEIHHRLKFLEELLESRGVEYLNIRSSSKFLIGETFELIMLLDMITYYLSIARGVDPTPVPIIEELKRYLSTTTGTLSRIQAELESF